MGFMSVILDHTSDGCSTGLSINPSDPRRIFVGSTSTKKTSHSYQYVITIDENQLLIVNDVDNAPSEPETDGPRKTEHIEHAEHGERFEHGEHGEHNEDFE